jgi:uncharacterized membrane protein YwaF
MLNPYFAFGVPLFLIVLYIIFAFIRNKSHIRYIGFVLLLIATFMVAFSFQVLQGYWTIERNHPLSYSPDLLWLPLLLGAVLAIVNIWRGVKRLRSFKEDSTN